jgi:transposase InsO family protein
MPPNEWPTNVYGPRIRDLRSSARRSEAIPGRVRGISTGLLRVVSAGGSVYRTVPGRSYLQTRVKRATPAKTAGDDTTAGSVCVSVQVSDESWIPDSRMTAGLRRGVGRREGDNLRRLPARALRFYRAHGIKVERLMTDNGSAYRSTVHAIACRTLKIKHIRTKPYRPRTNGEAERFIRTLLGGWAYGAIYRSSAERRPPCPAGSTSTIAADHTAPSGHRAPMERLTALQQGNNLVGSYT